MSDWMSMGEIASYCGGNLVGKDCAITGVCIDSRRIQPGELFVALHGEHFDGHDFINTDLEKKASGVLVHKAIETVLPKIQVGDTLDALTTWATNWRRKVDPLIVGITGSNGKTTVKQMTSSILSQAGNVCATRGNLNNHIGVPLTLLSLTKEHRFAVVEMGANHHGEIRHLSRMVEPDVAVINNVGPAHLEGFGSLQGVAKAKGEILEGLNQLGVAVLNADDPFYEYWLEQIGQKNKVIRFGLKKPADISAALESNNRILLKTPKGEIAIRLQALGIHSVYNALAASSCAIGLGIGLKHIKAGLESTAEVSGRLQLYKGLMGTAILDDTYNANPGSLRAAMEVLRQQPGVSWMVLGDMAELGEHANSLHYEVGQLAKQNGVNRLFCLGPLSQHAAEGFGEGACSYLDRKQLANDLLGALQPEICILVKGSRSMRMEEFVTLLKEPSRVH